MMVETIIASLPYIPGVAGEKPELLSRYLPPVPDAVISTWLHQNVPPGSWILDPFCASPRLVVEAARAGYRVLVTANNPISRFLLEINANPPGTDDLHSALAELAASYKSDERIEPHIRSLYNTHCARCGQIISADAFLWEQDSASPYMRIYNCPYCGDNGEHPSTAYDIERLKQYSASGLHKARALERVVAVTDQDRIHVEQALSVYLPRALYALITIVNKIEGLDISPIGQKYLSALLLHAFDQSNAMWKVPNDRERRRHLAIPRHFRENNVWLSLEQGMDQIPKQSEGNVPSNVPLTTWPELPSGSIGVCVYEGRLSSIADALMDLNIKSVCTAIPRPNHAFWTLSALWSGWLWGRESVGSFKSVLHRQRYDWSWHTTALASVFKQLSLYLPASTNIFGLIGETEPGFIASTLIAASISGCDLTGIALRNEVDQAQVLWQTKPGEVFTDYRGSLLEIAGKSARNYLEKRGEPASYLNTNTAALIAVQRSFISNSENQIPESISTTGDSTSTTETSPSSIYSRIFNSARDALSYRSGFLRFNLQDLSSAEISTKIEGIQSTLFSLDLGTNVDETDDNLDSTHAADEIETNPEKERPARSSDISESALMWLRDQERVNRRSITDQYELAVLQYLLEYKSCTPEEIDLMLCNKYPGLYTPDREFIRICLDSYGTSDQTGGKRYIIRSEDAPAERQIDLDTARKYLHQIASHLGINSDNQISGTVPSVLWHGDHGMKDYTFYLYATANVGGTVIFTENLPEKGFIVLPGSRANLILYKLHRDPRLNKAFDPTTGNWRFLKFRHLRSLTENPILNRDNLDQLLELDPLTYSTPQLRLI